MTAACNRGSTVAGVGEPGNCVDAEGCGTAPGTLAPGAVPLDVTVDDGGVPVPIVGNAGVVLGLICDCTWFAIWLGLSPDDAIWASCGPLSTGGVVTPGVVVGVPVEGPVVGDVDVVDDVDEETVVGVVMLGGVGVAIGAHPACDGMLRLTVLRLCAVWFRTDGGTLAYC